MSNSINYFNKIAEQIAVKMISRKNRIKNVYKRIYHYHIRKTGGSSINFAFIGSNTNSDVRTIYEEMASKRNHRIIINGKVFIGWEKRLIEQGYYFYGFSHIPAHQIKLPKDTFTITCLRDPLNRVMSHYYMLRYFVLNDIQHACIDEEGKWLGNSLKDFIGRIPKEHLFRQLYMFSINYDINEAYERIKNCSYLMFTEGLSSQMESLSEILEINLPIFHEKQNRYKEALNEETVAYLRELLEPEYRLMELLKK